MLTLFYTSQETRCVKIHIGRPDISQLMGHHNPTGVYYCGAPPLDGAGHERYLQELISHDKTCQNLIFAQQLEKFKNIGKDKSFINHGKGSIGPKIWQTVQAILCLFFVFSCIYEGILEIKIIPEWLINDSSSIALLFRTFLDRQKID